MAQTKPDVTYEEFCKLDLRVAKVLEVRDHPNADRLVCLTVDLGDQKRELIAGLKGCADCAALVGKNIVVVTNLAPRKMRGLESHGMLLAAVFGEGDKRNVVCLTTDGDAPPGAEVS